MPLSEIDKVTTRTPTDELARLPSSFGHDRVLLGQVRRGRPGGRNFEVIRSSLFKFRFVEDILDEKPRRSVLSYIR